MSHRVTTSTEINDKDLAISALKAANFTYVDQGQSLLITSGPMNRATINTKTGEVTGDTDYHNKSNSSLGALKQRYTEAKFRRSLQMNGGEILETTVNDKGSIVIKCRAALG